MSAPTQFYIVDAFTDEAFKGNPAGVVLSLTELDPTVKLNIVKELNQPALAFVSHPEVGTPSFATSTQLAHITWFAANGRQIAFCGHATMGASVVLLKQLYPTLDSIQYTYPKTVIGSDGASRVEDAVLKVDKVADGRLKIDAIAAYAPVDFSSEEEAAVLQGLQASLPLKIEDLIEVKKSLSKDQVTWDLLVVLKPTAPLDTYAPDFGLLAKLPFHGIWLTKQPSTASSPESFQSRVFFPSFGLNEDWVCGTAHTIFGPYWATTAPELVVKSTSGASKLEAHQVSPRPGRVGVIWDGRWGEEGGVLSLLGSGRILAAGQLFL